MGSEHPMTKDEALDQWRMATQKVIVIDQTYSAYRNRFSVVNNSKHLTTEQLTELATIRQQLWDAQTAEFGSFRAYKELMTGCGP